MTAPHWLLAFDTSGDACSVALSQEGALRYVRVTPTTHGHAALLLPEIETALEAAQLTWPDVTECVTTRGPGSFTGIRVGLAVAVALRIPNPRLRVAALTTLDAWHAQALRQEACQNRLLGVLVDSRRAEPFYQIFDNAGTPITPPGVLTPALLSDVQSEVPDLLWVGAAAAVGNVTAWGTAVRSHVLADFLDPGVLVACAHAACPEADLAPLYVRPPAIHGGARVS